MGGLITDAGKIGMVSSTEPERLRLPLDPSARRFDKDLLSGDDAGGVSTELVDGLLDEREGLRLSLTGEGF